MVSFMARTPPSHHTQQRHNMGPSPLEHTLIHHEESAMMHTQPYTHPTTTPDEAWTELFEILNEACDYPDQARMRSALVLMTPREGRRRPPR